MKKNFLPFILTLTSLALVGCASEVEPVEVSLESISISGAYKTQYFVGEDYDPMGLKVYAHYSDNSQKQILTKDYTVTGFDSSTPVESLPLTISYTEKDITKTAQFTVAILGEIEPEKVTVNIELTTQGFTEYSGTHSTLWINSSFKLDESGTSWTNYPLTQDEENPNLWKYSFTDVTVGQVYSYNFVYGSETTPRWDGGKNLDPDGNPPTTEEFHYTFEISEDATDSVSMVVTHSFNVIPDVDPEDAYVLEVVLNHDAETSTVTGGGVYATTSNKWYKNGWQGELVADTEDENVWKYTYNSDVATFYFGICVWGTGFSEDGRFYPEGTTDDWLYYEITIDSKSTHAVVTFSDEGMTGSNPNKQCMPTITGGSVKLPE